MEYAVEMESRAMIYIQRFMKVGSGIRKLMGRGYTQTYGQHDDLISRLLFSQNKESRLKHFTLS
jgi:hypothetical protein